MPRIKWILVITALLSISLGCSAETVYKSVDKDGNITFSDKPIPGVTPQKKLTITPPNPAKEKRRVQQLERQLSANGKTLDKTAAKRQRLQQQLKRAYATLGVTQSALKRAKAEADKQFKVCIERAAREAKKGGNSVLCKTNDLSALQALVATSQARVDRIKLALDNLPR